MNHIRMIPLLLLFFISTTLTLTTTAAAAAAFTSFSTIRTTTTSTTRRRSIIQRREQRLSLLLHVVNNDSSSSPATTNIILNNNDIELPKHASNEAINTLISKAQLLLNSIYETSCVDYKCDNVDMSQKAQEVVFANSYVDLGRVDTVGFDFDYTLATYTDELLEVIYDIALGRLVRDKQYPSEILDAGLKFDPAFAIRGLAIDRQNGWLCHLSYTHQVSVAFSGKKKVSRDRLLEEYSGKRALPPNERKKRLKPLNDIFSMAECCLLADVKQWFKDNQIPYHPGSVVNDILSVIGSTHMSFQFHRMVAESPKKYLKPMKHLGALLESFKKSGKRLILVSNSPFWYVDAGMKHIIGENWRVTWDAVIVSAGKPSFYTEVNRPFREVSTRTDRIKFKQIDKIEPGEVYTEGCLQELIRCLDWHNDNDDDNDDDNDNHTTTTTTTKYYDDSSSRKKQKRSAAAAVSDMQTTNLASPNVLYIGDSLFADLVDAKREFGWTTAAVAPEAGYEIENQKSDAYEKSEQIIQLLVHLLRQSQVTMGNKERLPADAVFLDGLESLVSRWRDRQTDLMENSFGSVFRARFQPSLFSHSLRRYCDLYMSSVDNLIHYSPQHRFYPKDSRLLSHELLVEVDQECYEGLLVASDDESSSYEDRIK